MPLTDSSIRRARAARPWRAAATPASVPDPAPIPGAELRSLLDDLVDAIAVRESFDPDSAGWDTNAVIRRLERELVRAWTAAGAAWPEPVARRWPL